MKYIIFIIALFIFISNIFSIELGESKESLLDSLELFGYKECTNKGYVDLFKDNENYKNLEYYQAIKVTEYWNTTYGYIKSVMYGYFYFKDDILIAIKDVLYSTYNNIQPIIGTYVYNKSIYDKDLGKGNEIGDYNSDYILENIDKIELIDKYILLGKIKFYCSWDSSDLGVGAICLAEKIKNEKAACFVGLIYIKL